MEKISGIYCILNTVNQKRYIGKSNNIYKRWMDEKSSLRRKDFHNKHFQRAWYKYGEDSFDFSILEICDDDKLATREQFWISYFDSYNNGYNQTLGGEGSLGVLFTEERKQKLREAHLGENNFNTKPVYCWELKKEFWGAQEAENLYYDIYDVHSCGVSQCCRGRQAFCGTLEDGTRLHWCFVKDKDNFLIPIPNQETPVYCIELDEIFQSIAFAVHDPRINKIHTDSVIKCCKGYSNHTTAGRLDDGTKLTWRYLTDEEFNKHFQHFSKNKQ